jgi:polar amino acid transport system permease protein
VIFYAAYLSEIFRSALGGVHAGQREGAQALGMSRMRTFRTVVLPQAVRLALPGTSTMLVDLLKSTSLLVTIAAGELMSQAQLIASETFRAMEVYLVIAALYFAVCYPLSQLLLLLERKVAAGVALTPGRRRRLARARALLETTGSPA